MHGRIRQEQGHCDGWINKCSHERRVRYENRISDLRVNDVSDTVVQNGVGEGDLCIVDPSGTIRQYSECQVVTLQRSESDISQRWRENHIVGDDVVLEDCLEGLEIGRSENRSDSFESFVGRDEDGEVGNVETFLIGTAETHVEPEVGGFKGSVHVQVTGSVGEELQGSTKREYRVDFVDCDTLAELDVL